MLAAEGLLTGDRAGIEARLSATADVIADAADLVGDHEGSTEYKRHLIHVLLGRVFQKALQDGICTRVISSNTFLLTLGTLLRAKN